LFSYLNLTILKSKREISRKKAQKAQNLFFYKVKFLRSSVSICGFIFPWRFFAPFCG